jgi:hypothetical protein
VATDYLYCFLKKESKDVTFSLGIPQAMNSVDDLNDCYKAKLRKQGYHLVYQVEEQCP